MGLPYKNQSFLPKKTNKKGAKTQFKKRGIIQTTYKKLKNVLVLSPAEAKKKSENRKNREKRIKFRRPSKNEFRKCYQSRRIRKPLFILFMILHVQKITVTVSLLEPHIVPSD